MPADLYYRVSVAAGDVTYDLSRDLTALSIEEDETRPALLLVRVPDPYKVFGHALQEGMDVEVELGRADDHSLVFRGRVHQVEASFPADGVSSVTVRAHDNGMRMGLRRRNRRWADKRLSEITRSIAAEHGFGAQRIRLVGDPQFRGNGIRQSDETDLAFLHRLADAYGAETYVNPGPVGDEFVFLAQRDIMTSQPEVTLYHGRTGVPGELHAFDARADVASVQLPRAFAGVDYDRGEALPPVTAPVEEVGDHADAFFDEHMSAFSAQEPQRAAELQRLLGASPAARRQVVADLGTAERVPTAPFSTAEDLRTWQENQFSTSIHGMRGTGSTGGNQALRAQTNVRLEDLGGRFSGVWFLTRVRHVLDAGGYSTDFECSR